MRRVALIGLVLVSTACRYTPQPTQPTNVTQVVTVTNGPTTPTPAPQPTPTPTPGGTTGPRTPDPTPPGVLPLPTYGSQVLQAYSASSTGVANLAASCQNNVGSFTFIDGLVDLLRKQDTRWGYACKRQNCSDLAFDVVSYHATSGPDVTGAAGVHNVDVVQDFCGMNPVAQWAPLVYSSTDLWSTRGRF